MHGLFSKREAASNNSRASKTHDQRATKSKDYRTRDFERLRENPNRESADAFHRDHPRMPAQLSRLLRLRRYAPGWRQTAFRAERFPRRRARQWRPGIGVQEQAHARLFGGRRTPR